MSLSPLICMNRIAENRVSHGKYKVYTEEETVNFNGELVNKGQNVCFLGGKTIFILFMFI